MKMTSGDYFGSVGEAIKFLMALGSITGLLGVICAFLGLLFLGSHARKKLFPVLFISVALIGICGLYTGLKYFRIHF